MSAKIFLFFLLIAPLAVFSQIPKRVSGAGISGAVWRYKNFPSALAERRNVDVWLPENYSKNKKYAVIYMHDGQNLFNLAESFGGVDWNVDETLQNLMKQGKVRDAIVVGIWNTARRTIEYAPQKAFDAVNRKKSKPSKFVKIKENLSDKYLKFIVSELKPFIDKKYSTKPDRDNTFVAGSSMGGLMSLYAISEYPQIFGGAACLSTHFPLGEGVMIEYMKKNLPAPKTHKIYFDYGTETLDATYEPFQKRADSLMKKKGYKQNKNWVTRKFAGGEHSEKSWRQRVDVPLVFLLGK